MFNGDIFMVCVTEFHRPPLFFIQSLFVCLLSWSRPFAMAENSLVDSGFKGMSCSTPANPFKAGNPFKSESVSSVDSPMHVESPGRRFQSADVLDVLGVELQSGKRDEVPDLDLALARNCFELFSTSHFCSKN